MRFASLVDKYRNSDVTLDQMLKSYQNSVRDPDNEFVHYMKLEIPSPRGLDQRKAQ
jgi:hypothetical protein